MKANIERKNKYSDVHMIIIDILYGFHEGKEN